MKRYLLYLLIVWQSVATATTTLKLEPSHIHANDTFHLILSSDNAQSSGLPNLTPLQQDFSILGTERRLSYSMMNGQMSSRSQWIILLRPKKVGKLSIPAIQVGQEQTKPSVIDVSNEGTPVASSSSDDLDDAQEPLLLKTSVSESHPYVNQQVIYTVKLYSNKQLIHAEYHPPSVENALLIPLGDGRHYQSEIHGDRYAVEEQQYAIFPQKSGELTLRPPSFHATVYDDVPREVTVDAKATPITVRPAPVDFQGNNWLPAKKVTLTETYDPPKDAFKEGDTLTRVVTLQAVSMPAQLLPTISLDTKNGFNVYPETPEVKNSFQHNQLIGTSTIKVTYLLHRTGSVTIPKLSVPWFNTTTGQMEVAVLPARSLHIDAKKTGQKMLKQSTHAHSIMVSPKAPPKTLSTDSPKETNSVVWAFVAGLGVAFAFMALWWGFKSFSRCRGVPRHQSPIKRLQNACLNHQPDAARDALLDWAHTRWPSAHILNLQDIGSFTRDSALKKQFQRLTQALYDTNQTTSWTGDELWRSFNAYLQTKPMKEHQRSNLPPINPVS